jgi:hypothetical protein
MVRAAGLPQPQWQLVSWQRQAFSSHPQEQLPHAQLALAVFFVAAFFTLDIVFLLFDLSASCAFTKADGRPGKTLH